MRCKATTQSGDRCKNTAREGSDYCYIASHRDKKQKLNPKQEQFCQLYVSQEFFGNGTQSYAEAYGIDLQNRYRSASSAAERLLRNVDICNRISELLDDAGLNDSFVDKQLLMIITQNADFSNKMAAIREYNKLKGRIIDKKEDVTKEPKRLVLIGSDTDE